MAGSSLSSARASPIRGDQHRERTMTVILFGGVDVREDPANADPSWDVGRRSEYLLRVDIRRPLSVDRRVWRPYASPDGQPVPGRLPWQEVEEARQRVEAWPKRQSSCVIIVIGVIAERADEQESLARNAGLDAEVRVDPAWQFVGYDVADDVDCSGLCNCGYRAEHEAVVPRNLWAPRLNEHGLFASLDHALTFRTLTNRRVPEHAPFFVYGLWIVG